MRREVDMTLDDTRAFLTSSAHDPYGSSRVYAVYSERSRYAGQIASVKSTHQLDALAAEGFTRLYMVTSDGRVPIRRA